MRVSPGGRVHVLNIVILAFCGGLEPAFAQTDPTAPSGRAAAAPSNQSEGESVSETSETSDSPDGEMTEEASDGPAESEEPSTAEVEVDPYAEARERVQRAEQLYEDGNYDAALTEFQRAYETMTGHPARNYVLFNIGKCQEKLYRYDAAINSYRTYLENSSDGAEDKGAVEAKIELLEGLLGTLEIRVTAKKGAAPTNYEVWVDGRLLEGSPRSFMIPGGNHQIEVRAEGFETANQEVQVPSRSEKSLTFELTPLAKEYRGLPKTYFWTAAGLAGAAGIAGGTFGMLTISKKNSLNQQASETITQDDADSLKNQALMADVFFVGAGVFATTAVILAFMTDWSDGDKEKSPIEVKEVGFAPTQGGGFVGLRGAF